MRAVDQVSFEIHAGEALGLVGESGSGKTTVGRAVLQLIPASAGVVMLIVGYLLIRFGLATLSPAELTPRQTIATLKEDAQWLKAQTK